MLSIIIITLSLCMHRSVIAEKPIIPAPQDYDLPTAISILQDPIGYELIQRTTHFTQASLHFLQLISDQVVRTTNGIHWVHTCKKIYSLLNTLHHQSNLLLTQLAMRPQKGIIASEQEWIEISAQATLVAQQKNFLSSKKMRLYLQLIAQTESALLTTSSEKFITHRIRTYRPPTRYD